MDKIMENREFMKATGFEDDTIETDQERELPQPPVQKSHDPDGRIIDLPEADRSIIKNADIFACLENRKSRRKYTNEAMTMKELSFLLWATQGVKYMAPNRKAAMRPVASAGARHPFETYIVVNRVEGLPSGIYRYLAISNQLLHVADEEELPEKMTEATLGQKFAGDGAVVLIWACIPYRGEWKYSILAHKPMLLDAGHICQNLYLACEAIGWSTCAIAAYDQKMLDGLIRVDGVDEYAVYLAPIGKAAQTEAVI